MMRRLRKIPTRVSIRISPGMAELYSFHATFQGAAGSNAMMDPLIARSLRGDLSAMESLYEAHRQMVYAVGLSVCGNGADADEVLQETFLRAFRSLAEWRGESQFSTWLYAIAL